MSEWIKLSEKKPENGQQCLIYVHDNSCHYYYFGIQLGSYNYDEYEDFAGFDSDCIDDIDQFGEQDPFTYISEREEFNKYVTHWMPLPEEPKD